LNIAIVISQRLFRALLLGLQFEMFCVYCVHWVKYSERACR